MALFCSEDFIFHTTFGRSVLRAARFSSLNTAIIWKSSWQLSHLSNFPLIFQGGWILLVPAAQEHSIPSSHLPSVVPAVISQLLRERREANKYGRGLLWIYSFCCWQSSVCFSFHLIFPKNPSKRFYYLVRAMFQGYWMNCQNPKCSRPSWMQQQLCKAEWEQCPVPPAGNSREILQGAL